MTEDVSPTIARRNVRLALRDARERAKLTQPQVAEAMEWSLSKVIRIENGDVSIAPNDLKPLLTYLNVKDRTEVAELLAFAKIARTRQRTAWYQKPGMKEHLTGPNLRLIEYEAEAVEIRYYQVFYMPGPLQVPAYGHANLDTYSDDDIPSETRRIRVEARQHRRETVLNRLGNGLAIFALLDESVFRRPLGGPEVFLEQLRDLNDLVAAGKIKLRMIPFDFDSAAVTNNATFDLLTLRSGKAEERSEVLYRETGLQDEIVEDHTVRRHHERFDKIWNAAATEEDTIDFMGSRIKDLEAQIRTRKNP
ncbi:transcriptional regulator with XRE-family HTH domain [Actinoplanes tereljensis]|uniref:Transcriptional regulator n=1 Tax=Paractinoplanes tereljensis TaxID=571912 RepID=A0A919NKW5_9ACTN|nr:helix-turn-helix transcriptional regulator [Actinoplanes tereljensis]GIF19826.1 transcriptional regulator [Actinoplanes tereljensis]